MEISPPSTVYNKTIRHGGYLVDRPKLSRMVNIILDKLGSEDSQSGFKLNATLQSGKEIRVVSLDALFSLDNSPRDPIHALNILAYRRRMLTRVEIEYGGRVSDRISLRVESSDQGIALQLFAELEEQIERTILRDLVSRYSGRGGSLILNLGALLTFGFALTAGILGFGTSSSNSERELAQLLLTRYPQVATQEQKIDFIFAYTYGQLAKSIVPETADFLPARFFSFQSALVILPILLVGGIVIYLITRCYPRTNFLWGDYEEYYAQLIAKRHNLWNFVIGSIVLSIVANLFVIGLSGTMGFGQ